MTERINPLDIIRDAIRVLPKEVLTELNAYLRNELGSPPREDAQATTKTDSLIPKTITPLYIRDVGIPKSEIKTPEGVQKLRGKFRENIESDKFDIQLHLAQILNLAEAKYFDEHPDDKTRLIKGARDPVYLEEITILSEDCEEVLTDDAWPEETKKAALLQLRDLKMVSDVCQINKQPEFDAAELPPDKQKIIIDTWNEFWPQVDARFRQYLPRSEKEVVNNFKNSSSRLIEQYRAERIAGRDGTDIDLDSFLKDIEDLELLGGLQTTGRKEAILKFGADPIIRYALMMRIANTEAQFLVSNDASKVLGVLKKYIHLGELLGFSKDSNNPVFREAAVEFNKIREKYANLEITPTTIEPTETLPHTSSIIGNTPDQMTSQSELQNQIKSLQDQLHYYKELYWLKKSSNSVDIPLDQLLRTLRLTYHQNFLLKMSEESYGGTIRDQQDEMRWLSEERDVYLLRIGELEIRLGRESRAVADLRIEVDKLNKISGILFGENTELKAQLGRLGIQLSEAVRNGVHLKASNTSLTDTVASLRSQLEKANEELGKSKAENEKIKEERQQEPEWIKGQQGFVKMWRAARTNLTPLKPGETGNEPSHVLSRFKTGMDIIHEVSPDINTSVPVLSIRARAGIEYLIPEIWPDNRILTRFFERPQELLSLNQDDLAKIIYIPEKYRSLTKFGADQKREISRIHRVLISALHSDTVRSNADPNLEESIADLLKYFNPAWTIVEKLIK